MCSPQAALSHLHPEEGPLWTTLAEPTWERMVCSRGEKWLLARLSRPVCPVCGKFEITDQSQSLRGKAPSWWPMWQWTAQEFSIHTRTFQNHALKVLPFLQRCTLGSRCRQLWSSIYSLGEFLVLCTKVWQPKKQKNIKTQAGYSEAE